MGSSRLPGKVVKEINSSPIIEIILKRLSKSTSISKVVVATTNSASDDVLGEIVSNAGFDLFRGSEDNVLQRFYECAKYNNAQNIIRITGDCPLIDPVLIDKVVNLYFSRSLDYCSNINPPTFPDGLDIEIFKMQALEQAFLNATSVFDKEHVTPYIRKHALKQANYENQEDLSNYRLTLDNSEDFKLIKYVFESLQSGTNCTLNEVIDLAKSNPNYFRINKMSKRNDGSSISSGQKLYSRAKEIIPGGNMLLSKRPEMFLPNQWPAYFSSASGITVTDLDNREYIDLSLMGVGTNILGYANRSVDDAVSKKIFQGNMTTLNCKEEVMLAERLIELHPWFEMSKFARTGGEANAVSIRIARAATGKDNVAVCGYHGWHDWYISSNLDNENNLSDHLLEGLPATGVPKVLNGTVFPFKYNDIDGLKDLIYNNNIGTVKMEVCRNFFPEDNFLEQVRFLCDKHNIVLIFDECTSGFRETFGGLHSKFKVYPDMAMFGKALGNGYAITAILGKKDVMEAAQSSFISSTFWTERIGPTAALKTLSEMEKIRSWEIITHNGKYLQDELKKLSSKYKLDLNISGIPALTTFNFSDANLIKKSYLTQEMLKRGYLATTAVYLSVLHTKEVLNRYLSEINDIFYEISLNGEEELSNKLDGPACHAGFERLN